MRLLTAMLGPACLAVALAAWLAPAASAAVTSQTIGATANPSTQSKTAFGAVSLQFQFDAAYDSYDPPTPMQSGGTFHLDNDFQFDRTGLSQCSPATINGLSTAAAIAACPGSQVGSGSATGRASIGSAPGTITAFNGTPSGSDPTLLLHFDFGFLGTADAVGVMSSSTKGGDFGTQIAFGSLPTIAETALTHADVTLTNQEPSPGHHYVSARCNDSDKTWNFAGDFTFADTSSKQASATQSCSLTGNGVMNGTVREPISAGNDPLPGALVWACGVNTDFCSNDTADSNGAYSIGGLPADDYFLSAYPPSTGPPFTPAQDVGPFAVNESVPFTHDLTLGDPPVPPPSNTTVTQGTESRTGPNGVPAVYMFDPFALATNACPGASVTYTIAVSGNVVRNAVAMTESPPGSGHYSATVTPLEPAHGVGRVAIDVDCPTDPDPAPVLFDIYIDPSGIVKDAATGSPISGATVTLLRSDVFAGPFDVVPNGDAIMSPSNRKNPDTTNGAGHFGWDVIGGYYKVRATAPGCNTAETDVLTIPPPVTDLELALNCPVPAAAPSQGAAPPPAPPARKRKCKKAKKGSAEAAKKKCKKKRK
ncbi:MAG: carboxypeptidase-like regulatory domain-containing protein [Solirubrobacterales bacterium]